MAKLEQLTIRRFRNVEPTTLHFHPTRNVTSQNPILFDYLEFASAEDLQRQFVLCGLGSDGGRPRLRWTQTADEKATAFFGAYERGVQYISEILQTEGLW